MSGAAKLLGITYGCLRSQVHADPDLRARHTRVNRGRQGAAKEAKNIDAPSVPDDMSDLGRKQELVRVEGEALLTDKRVAAALIVEDANLKDGLSAIGLSPQAIKSAEALQKFHNTHFTRSVEIIGGGMTKTFVEIMAEVENINARLEEGGLTLEEEQMLRQDRSRLLEIQGRTYDRSLKASMTQAIIQQKLADSGGVGAIKRGKPGFTPIVAPIVNAIKIESTGPVTVSSGNAD